MVEECISLYAEKHERRTLSWLVSWDNRLNAGLCTQSVPGKRADQPDHEGSQNDHKFFDRVCVELHVTCQKVSPRHFVIKDIGEWRDNNGFLHPDQDQAHSFTFAKVQTTSRLLPTWRCLERPDIKATFDFMMPHNETIDEIKTHHQCLTLHAHQQLNPLIRRYQYFLFLTALSPLCENNAFVLLHISNLTKAFDTVTGSKVSRLALQYTFSRPQVTFTLDKVRNRGQMAQTNHTNVWTVWLIP